MLQVDPTALVWLLLPTVLLPSVALVFLIHPDPRAIAANLQRFYPRYQPSAEQQRALSGEADLVTWLEAYPLRLALVATFAAHGVMAMMALTPLEMAHRGYVLTMIATAVAVHVIGMYGRPCPWVD